MFAQAVEMVKILFRLSKSLGFSGCFWLCVFFFSSFLFPLLLLGQANMKGDGFMFCRDMNNRAVWLSDSSAS